MAPLGQAGDKGAVGDANPYDIRIVATNACSNHVTSIPEQRETKPARQLVIVTVYMPITG